MATLLVPVVFRLGSTGSSCAMQRLQVVLGHLSGQPPSGWNRGLQAAPCSSCAPPASAEDVVVVHGRRTAIGRGNRGGFKVRPWVRAPGARWWLGAGWGLASMLGSLWRPSWLRSRALTALLICGEKLGAGSEGPGTSCSGGMGSPQPRFPLQDTTPDELLSAVLTAVLQDVKLSPSQLGDICVGEDATRILGSILFALLSRLSPQIYHHPPGVFTEGNVNGLANDEFVFLGLAFAPPPGIFCAPPRTFCILSMVQSRALK